MDNIIQDNKRYQCKNCNEVYTLQSWWNYCPYCKSIVHISAAQTSIPSQDKLKEKNEEID